MSGSVLWLFLVVPWVGLQCVIMVFPDVTFLCKIEMVDRHLVNQRPDKKKLERPRHNILFGKTMLSKIFDKYNH